MWFKKNFPYWLLVFSVVSAIMALTTSGFIFKSGTAAVGVIILIILMLKAENPPKETWLIIGAFLFSIAGDWFLSNMDEDPGMFIKGIALYFLAHIGYLVFALLNGRINWSFTGILLAAFLAYYILILYPAFDNRVLGGAALVYLLVSCMSLGAAVGMRSEAAVKWTYVFGIFLILLSDTIISQKEFLGYDALNFLILPTYYLAHISVTFALIRKNEQTGTDPTGQ